MISLLLAACVDGAKDDTAGTPINVAVKDLSAVPSPGMGSVLITTWTTDEPTVGHVAFGESGAFDLASPAETAASTSHQALLLGAPPDTDITLKVVLEDGSESDTLLVSTDPLPLETPSLDVTSPEGNDLWTVMTILGGTNGPAIVSPGGRIVWFYPDSRGLDVYRARLSVDGASVLYNAASVSGDPADNSEIVRVSLDGNTETSTLVPLLAHDFVELPDGTITAMVTEYRDGTDGEPIRGDSLVEITPDGTQTVVWDSWMCFDPEVEVVSASETGWTFANALDYLPDEDMYAMSLRNFSTIIKIDRATGSCPWSLGDIGALIQPTGEVFLHEHQFEFVGTDTLVVFDNAGGREGSRAVEYALTETTASATWTYSADPEIDTFVLGDVDRLDNGDTLVDFAVGGQVDRVDPAGNLLWRINSPLGYAFGFMTPEEGLYR